jgi:subtilase family serine protease
MKKTSATIIRYTAISLALLFAVPGLRVSAETKPDSASATQAVAVPARITQAIDETQLVTLKGNVHPLAQPEFDKGAVPSSQPMKRMLLLLQRSPEQQAALQQLMLQQQSKDSPNFHKWLVPQQFGVEFGPADADIQTVTDWLTRQGFQVVRVANGRTLIEFSGNAAQVQSAFHTEIHKFVVNGETHSANVSDPQIPAALAPVVKGIVSLHNFPRRTDRHDAGIHKVTRDEHGVPQFTGTTGCGPNHMSQCFFVGPADFAKIYNVPASLDGTGVTIGIVGDSNIDPNDAIGFRNVFGLTPATAPNIIVDGPDPGISGPIGDEGEGDLDVQISGMVAPKATIDFVVAEGTLTALGTDIAAFHIIDYNLADVMSESFGSCEPGLGTMGVQFYNLLWEEAAAQGTTVMVSAGDSGSASCDNFNTQSVAVNGLAISGVASTPFNVAVGGTDFDDVGVQSNFWTTNNVAGTLESAKGYIPETTWNDSCAATATSANLATVCAGALATNIVAGGGGPSAFNAKPTWQSGLTPADGSRDVPDVSLFASDGPQSLSLYPFCEADGVPAGNPPSCAASGPFTIGGAGGTSASSPAFAGIMALIVQKMGGVRQGNANFVLYKIAATAGQSCNSTGQALSGSTCAFNDVTKGNNSVPCTGGALANCSATTGNGVLVDPAHTTTPAWTTTTAYDYATGLGSVNVTNLATQWPLAVGTFKATTSSLTLNGATTTVTITHGASVTASATVAVVSPATGTPTGDVSLVGPQGTINSGINANTLTGTTPDTANLTTTSLPGGSYTVMAHYAGDGTFAPSDSNAVAVMVNRENSRLQMSVVTLDPVSGNILNTNATSYPYGSFTFLRFDILNSSANPCQSLVNGGTITGCAFDAQGAVTVTDNGSALNGGTFKINSEGSAEDQVLQLTAGTHPLSATYSGDVNYNPVTTPVTEVITVSQATTATALVADRTTATTAQTVTLTATVATQSIGVGPSGMITFSTCGTPPCTAMLVPTTSNPITGTFSSATASLPTIFTTPGTKTITATYAGDANYTGSGPSTAVTVTVTQVGNFSVSYSPQPLVLSSTTGAAVPLTITVTPAGGFAGTVAVTPATLPPGVSCTPSPLNINVVSATPVASQLMCMVMATSTTLTASRAREDGMFEAKVIPPANAIPRATPGKGWWTLSAGTGFAALFLLLLHGGRKKYRAALGLGLVCLLSLTLGCGGGGGGGTTQTATVTKLTVTSGKVASGTAFSFSVSVTGGTPTGMVELFDNGTMIGTAATVTSGTATPTAPALSVGTHSISAHYLGDATTLGSASGTLNLTVTGSTTATITTNPVGTPAAPAINITIQ